VDRDHCLLLYPLPEWEDIERNLDRLPGLNRQVRQLQRLLIGHATEVEMDGAGRILLPGPLREFADLTKHTVLIGQGKKFEIWNEDSWNAQREQWFEEQDKAESLPPELESLSL